MKGYFSILLLVGGFIFLSTSEITAQRFKGSAVFGLNLSQIDGDELFGYRKLGLHGGFKLSYPVKEKIDISLEMLYSQAGSTAGFGFGNDISEVTTLNYISLPLLGQISDWYIEDQDYYKVSAHIGLSPGYLFSVSSFNGLLEDDIDNYNQVELAYILGVTYRWNRKTGTTIRYTRSITDLLPTGAISYYVSVRQEIYF